MMDKSSRDSERINGMNAIEHSPPPTGKLNDSEKSVDVKFESW